MIVLKNILVATDFGAASGAALDYGRDLARSYGATLHVLNVVDNIMVKFAASTSMAVLPEMQTLIEEGGREQLNALITDEDRMTLNAKPMVLTSIGTAEAISHYARERRIDLIVIGTHGRGTLEHMLMGSVAERVVRTAPCPVLTVRHPEREFVVPDALVVTAKA